MRFARYILIAFGLLLAACGGSPEITLENAATPESTAGLADETSDEAPAEATTEAAPVQVSTEEAAAAAEANMSLLAGGETVFDYEVLDVHTGAISSVDEVVDGDRSVLLWFFSPH